MLIIWETSLNLLAKQSTHIEIQGRPYLVVHIKNAVEYTSKSNFYGAAALKNIDTGI